jgi:hypothetical protein
MGMIDNNHENAGLSLFFSIQEFPGWVILHTYSRKE